MDWQIIFSGLAFVISCIALWFSFAKYNKELYMQRKQTVFIEFYSALKEFYDFLGIFIENNSDPSWHDDFGDEDRKYMSGKIDIFLEKYKTLFFAYKKFIPYLNSINKIDSEKLNQSIDSPTLESFFLDLKNICNDKENGKYVYGKSDFSGRMYKITCTGNCDLKWIKESNALEYLENEIIL